MALAEALLFAGGTVAYAFMHLQQLLTERVSQWMQTQSLNSTAVSAAFVAYGVALIGIHLVLGVCIWVLAVASRQAVQDLDWSLHRWILGWGAALILWALLANAVLFPQSIFTAWLALDVLGIDLIQTIFWSWSSLVFVLALRVLLPLVMPTPAARKMGLRMVVYAVLTVGAIQVIQWTRQYSVANASLPLSSRPNVVIIGIDSLRADMVAAEDRVGLTPAIDKFLAGAVCFDDAVTPMARTFPAWASILRGQSPVTTGVRANLVPRKLMRPGHSVADYFDNAGYRTVYATDEVRFSYIDATFGFQQVVSPRFGITDFALGSFNDLPLSNLLANTRIARWLFPNTYANRAAFVTYRTETFIEWLEQAVEFDGPTLFATHLTLPHWPYYWSEPRNAVFANTFDTRYAYESAVIAADRQFDMLMKMLERKGALRNAIVVLLSDHGEGLGLPRDNEVYSQEAKQAVGPLEVRMLGHGNSVLSPYQYKVVLAMRRFGSAAFQAKSPITAPASLEDVTPTVMDLASVDASGARFEGISWAHTLITGELTDFDVAARVRFTETGLVVGFTRGGQIDEGSLADRSIKKYEIEPETSRLVLREDALRRIIEIKERAAFTQQHLLAAVPAFDGKKMRYVLVDRQSGAVTNVAAAPDESDAAAYRLWNALHKHYPGEIAQ